jgi:hypothetical protein
MRKWEMKGVRLCWERDGPSYVMGSAGWGFFGFSGVGTRNRGLGVGIPLGRCGFDIFLEVEGKVGGGGEFAGN